MRLWPWNEVVGFWSTVCLLWRRRSSCWWLCVRCSLWCWTAKCWCFMVMAKVFWELRIVRSDISQRRDFYWMISGTPFLLFLLRSYSGQRGRSDRPSARQPTSPEPSSPTARDEDALTVYWPITIKALCVLSRYTLLLCLRPWDHGADHGSMGHIVVHP